MKILMTGATGLVGRELGLELVRRGHTLNIISRDKKRAVKDCPFPCLAFEWNFRDASFPAESLDGVDAIIHLAGEGVADKRWSREHKEKIYRSRVHSTRILVEKLKTNKNNVRHFILASATGFYGGRGDDVLTESTGTGDGFLSEVCRDWEAALFTANPKNSNGVPIRTVAIRTGVVLSPEGGALTKMIPIFQKGMGAILGAGSQWVSWIHMRDLVGLFSFALESNCSGVINGVAPTPVTNRQFSESLAKHLGTRLAIPVPAFALKTLLGEMSQILLGSARVSAEEALRLGFKFHFSKVEDAFGDILVEFQNQRQVYIQKQWISKPPKEVFAFFSDEKNLERLTPELVNFHVLQKSTPSLQQGTEIDYKLKLHGFPIKWKTLIETWDPPREFVDRQIKGPYSYWHHTHRFEELKGGTLLVDRVIYKAPMGVVGQVVAGWKIQRDVDEIFTFRKNTISELFR